MKLSGLLILIFTCGCSVPNPFGTSTSASTEGSTCGSGGFGPVPHAVKAFDHKVYLNEAKLRAAGAAIERGSEFVALVDRACAAKRVAPHDDGFAALFTRQAQRHHGTRSAFALERLTLKKNIARADLEKFAQRDTCTRFLEENQPVRLASAPNDPQYAASNHLQSLEMSTAWDFFFAAGAITQNVLVAVIDVGGDINHPDLSATKWVNPAETAGNSLDDDSNGYVDDVNGYNFVSRIGDPSPQNVADTHGTEVAGILGAKFNNGIGSAGIMGDHIQIMHLNIAGTTDSPNSAALFEAIQYAGDNGAQVINLSLGTQSDSPTMKTLIQTAIGQGSLVIAAAGNESSELTATRLNVPASYGSEIEGLISVGSIDSSTGTISSFSNYSSQYVELMAPGGESATLGLFTTVPGSDPVNSYTRAFGTSFSTPIVAGAAALAIGYMKSHGQNPSPADLEDLILASADSNNALSGKVQKCRTLSVVNIANQLLP